jgi:hypothetical protein
MEQQISLPELEDIRFTVNREVVDEDGIFNPIDGEGTYEGAFQVNIHAHRKGYQELARFFLALSQYDVGGDSCFHVHLEGAMSCDNRTRIHLIFRKDDERYEHLYPKY